MSALLAHPFATAIVSMGGALCFVGWFGAVVGPTALIDYGLVGCLFGVAGFWFTKDCEAQPDVESAHQLRKVLNGIVGVLAGLAVLSLVTMFASGWSDGVAEFPALEQRERYELNSHGSRTEVSRLQYVANAISFATGWHALALMINIVTLQSWLFGGSATSERASHEE